MERVYVGGWRGLVPTRPAVLGGQMCREKLPPRWYGQVATPS